MFTLHNDVYILCLWGIFFVETFNFIENARIDVKIRKDRKQRLYELSLHLYR